MSSSSSKDEEDEKQVDHYGILGLEPLASVKEVNRAARKLSLKYHPDKNASAEAAVIFLRLQKSKEFLNDNVKREAYDKDLENMLKRKKYEEERKATMDQGRSRAKADFEARLAAASSKGTVQAQERADAKKDQEIILRLRRDNIARVAAANEEVYERQFQQQGELSSSSGGSWDGNADAPAAKRMREGVEDGRCSQGGPGRHAGGESRDAAAAPRSYHAFLAMERDVLARLSA
jgi:DnaJ family protein C protein 17